MYKLTSGVLALPRTQLLTRSKLLAFGTSLLLAGCGDQVSDELAQDLPYDMGLAQCELANIGVMGTPTDPIMVDGVETQACLVRKDLPKDVGPIGLKTTHKYEPLVWILDGVYEIGESKTYSTLEELENDQQVSFGGSLYARENTLVIVHRNGSIASGTIIRSVDDDNVGGGEWGGVVVNGWGYHPDCPPDTSKDKLCNVEGDWGYFGGLSQAEAANFDHDRSEATGMLGSVAEAGGAVVGYPQLPAAVVVNAPLQTRNGFPQGVFYSAGNGLEVNGGNGGVALAAMGNQGHAIVWKEGFSGAISSSLIYHGSADFAALKGENPSGAGQPVELRRTTLVDRDLSAGTALELTGEHRIDGLVVQGFAACLQFQGPPGGSELHNSVFYCGQASLPASDGFDYAAPVLASASNYHEEDPDLTMRVGLGNADLVLPDPSAVGRDPLSLTHPNAYTRGGYDLRLLYEPCLGVGTLLDETIQLGPDTYSVCELEGTITENFKFDDDINDEFVVWALKGEVNLGESFDGMSLEEQRQALLDPQTVVMNGQSKVFGRPGASLTVNPGVALRAKGSSASPALLASIDAGTEGAGEWGGVTIKGIADSCGSAELCELADQTLVNVQYLRVLEAGAGRPALILDQVSRGGQLSHLDVSGSADGGVLLDGGAANLDYLIMAQIAGDQVAWRNGYTGTLQHAVLKSDHSSTGHALRGQNRATDHDASPRSRPVMANITAVGAENSASAILLEQGSGLLLYNSVVSGFKTCLDIDDTATSFLQHADPQGIHFGGVVLDCEATLVDEDESSGYDYGYTTQHSSAVYEVPAVLDTQFVASGADIPAAWAIDPTLPGDAAAYLNLGAVWMGGVRDSNHLWFTGWSDSVYVELAAECDYMGTLEDAEAFGYEYRESVKGHGFVNRYGNEVTEVVRYHKVCSLRGTLTEDARITLYTGADREAVEAGRNRAGSFLDLNGDVHTTDMEILAPLPTVWLLNGMVRVGEGHRELTDLAQVQAMKENPVTLTIDATTIIMAAESAGLHVTRGGALRIEGGPHYTALVVHTEGDFNTTGPVNLMGLLPRQTLYDGYSLGATQPAPVEPVVTSAPNWVGVIVDGFGRNNQCPDAATAEPGSQICNIPGEYGFHGGYDDDHGNVFIEHAEMNGGSLQFNSVGRGGSVEYLRRFRRASSGSEPSPVLLTFNGGAVNLGRILLEGAGANQGPPILWNNGYRGNLQHINVRASFGTAPDGVDVDGQSYPIIRGLNGEPGREDALPRSKPTLANLSLRIERASLPFPGYPTPGDGAVIDLAQGSGMYLYNSVLGRGPAPSIGTVEAAAYCFSADGTSAPLVGTEIVINQLDYACKALADHGSFEAALLGDSKSSVTAREYVFSGTSWRGMEGVEALKLRTNWTATFPAQAVVAEGARPLDHSSSTTVDPDFIQNTDHLGSEDYFLFQEYGGVVED